MRNTGRVYLTGDIHGKLDRIIELEEREKTTTDDVLIIAGDTLFNYTEDARDYIRRMKANKLPITIFSIRGNHDKNPEKIKELKETIGFGGKVLKDPVFPNLIYARDGEYYKFGNRSVFTIGGASTIDKEFRIENGWPWFSDEQHDRNEQQELEQKLEALGNRVDIMLTHTCPQSYVQSDALKEDFDQSKVDRSTEIWLEKVERKLQYNQWFCGHFHIDREIEKVRFIYEDIVKL